MTNSTLRRIIQRQPAGELRVDAETLRRIRQEQNPGELHAERA